ncbi:MAG: aminoacyl-histidine dipeptidase [Clostridiales bacterium]|nr:aminoacyl-histidine dipeptidase [Clostridiales bacterium]
MAILNEIKPQNVFRFFEELCAIPHGSTNTKQISDWLMAFARERKLEAYQDASDNVIIIREASPGYEKAAPVILQGHMDMVCEKAPGCEKDMDREGLDLVVDGDTVYAKGTTLGGDDGIAVAMALAVLDDDSIAHPRVEVVITSDEEIGMLGAMDLDVHVLKGRRMINLDSEAEGVFTVGCAGGNMTLWKLPVTRAAFEGKKLSIAIDGLRGGHSGTEIHKERGNANMLLGRVLYAASKKTELRVVEIHGGLKANAIPTVESSTLVAVDGEAIDAVCREMGAQLKNEFRITDPDIRITVRESEAVQSPMDQESTGRAICLLTCAPNGVQAMSTGISGLVQTSLNLGILETTETELTGSFCVRSSVDSQKEMVVDRLRCLIGQLGGAIEVNGDYSGWEYQQNSPLRDLMTEIFTEQYGYEPKIEAIHAGVECGIFVGKLPGLDCVSLGPDLTEIHTFRERMHIASVERVWAMLLETLKRMDH